MHASACITKHRGRVGFAFPSVVLSLLLSKTLNVLGLLVVDVGEVGSSILLCTQQLVEFSVYGLCVAVLRSLNKQRHRPGSQGRYAMPIQSARLKESPKNCVHAENDERERVGSTRAQKSKKSSDRVHVTTPFNQHCYAEGS